MSDTRRCTEGAASAVECAHTTTATTVPLTAISDSRPAHAATRSYTRGSCRRGVPPCRLVRNDAWDGKRNRDGSSSS